MRYSGSIFRVPFHCFTLAFNIIRLFMKNTLCIVRVWTSLAAIAITTTSLIDIRQSSGAEASAFASAMETILADELKTHTDTLAGDSFEGREGGSRGGRATANYLMKELESYGLEPAGDRNGYFQQFGSYRNVLAVLPGSDEKLKDEYIVVGAHFDHVGYGTKKSSFGPGYIHNGADDNASGTASLLELAEALAGLPDAPRRSVLFAFWDAEEKGLLGSKHWIERPTVPLEKVRMKINVDMVGRMTDDKVIVYGTRTAPGLRHLVARANEHSDLMVSYVWWINPRSDHYSFVKKKIPVLMLHTGLHNDYHRPSDDAHKLNIAGLRRLTQLFFAITHDLAMRDEIPAWRKNGGWEGTAQRKVFEALLPAGPPRLGITWDETGGDDSDMPDNAAGLVVKSVTLASAADLASLAVGDRIIQFDRQRIDSGDALQRAVLAAPREVEIVIERPGREEPMTLRASLAGQPVQLGISWRENTAEPQAVTVVRVLPGSPADDAGIERLDRIWAVNGERFADSEAFEKLALPSDAPVTFHLERNGRLLTAKVRPNVLSAEDAAVAE